MEDLETPGNEMHAFMARAFPICRSITGDGVRQTLGLIGEHLPLTIHEVPTGTRVFDWEVPREWNIREAWIADASGNRVVDFADHNLHVVNYSVPVNRTLSLEELGPHLHSLPDKPDAIPYITSYYRERWGFCMTHTARQALEPGDYHVYIDSDLKDGSLTYAECIIPGETEEEVFLSTYVCHPSMANNELSGPTVMTWLGKWLLSAPRRHTYRIVFIPETIGSLTYLSRNLDTLRSRVRVGFNLSCIGDDRAWSYVASRYGDTLADRVIHNVLSLKHPDFIRYPYLERGSDERQYGFPGVDLPLVSLCRSKYGRYPEYHTSLDNLDLVTPSGLAGGLGMVRDCLEAIEANHTYQVTCIGEPQLGRRGLYPTMNTLDSGRMVRTILNLLAYCDGSNDLIAVSDIIGVPVNELAPLAEKLVAAELFRRVS
jgi:aminopeptidase-like protein